jgi:hypothetical protein
MPSDLTDFLLARIAEDQHFGTHDRHLAKRWDAECEAKRRIVERYSTCLAENERNTADHEAFVAAGGSEFDEPDPVFYTPIDRTRTTDPFEAAGLAFAVQALALPYADHPDYRDEWRV